MVKKVKIEKDAKGRKFIKIGNKKLYIGQNISTKLLKTLLNIGYVQNLIINLNNRRKRRKAAGQSASLTPAEKAKLKDLEIKRAQLAAQVEIAQIKQKQKEKEKEKIEKVAPARADAPANLSSSSASAIEEPHSNEEVGGDSNSPPHPQEEEPESQIPKPPEKPPEKGKKKRGPYLKSSLKGLWGDAETKNVRKIINDRKLSKEQKVKEVNKYALAKNLPLIDNNFKKVAPQHDEKEEKGNLNAFLADDKSPPGGKSDSEDGLYSDQIDKIMNKLKPKGYLGCVARDEIKGLIKKAQPGKPAGFISNIDTSKQKGSHWVAVYIDPKSSLEYYDSFAEEMPKSMEPDVFKLADKIKTADFLKYKTNGVIQQDDKSANCGFFAMRFLIDRMDRGKSFVEATGYDKAIADKSKENEKQIERLKKMRPFSYL